MMSRGSRALVMGVNFSSSGNDILDWLNVRYFYREKKAPRMLVLIVCKGYSETGNRLAQELAYLHSRSEDRVDFFCVGYPSFKDGKQLDLLRDFAAERFAKDVAQLESLSTWRYSGQTDVLLLDVRLDSASNRATLDWSTVMDFVLERDRDIIGDLSAFFELVIRHASLYRGNTPTRSFSDWLCARHTAGAGMDILANLVPADGGQKLKSLIKACTKDRRK